MRQQSEDEEGFIPSGYEIKSKDKSQSPGTLLSPTANSVHYRYPGYPIKSQHPLALTTPLTLTHESSLRPPTSRALLARQQPCESQHPYKYYCCSNEFTLSYSKRPDQPLTNQGEFMKNELPLFNLQDPHSPALRQLKPFQLQEMNEKQQINQRQGVEMTQSPDQLVFDSKFENGNLHCAFRRRGRNEYHLFMENDTNTLGYSQWFYFAVRNARKHTRYTFHIVNYRKRLRFFEEGQRIVLFSQADAQMHKNGWRRAGSNYSLHQTPFAPSCSFPSASSSYPCRRFYTLSFCVQFPHDNDYAALASSLPYSYSKLLQELKALQTEALSHPSVKLSIQNVAQTICSNQVPQVTISKRHSQKQDKEKKLIIVMARQHPGQVWSSYLAQGFMRALLKDTPETRYILEHFIVKVIPMVNIDGVIYGNFRCDVTGVDLNRRWQQPSPVFHPHITALKRRMLGYSRRWKVELCMDLHGHSKKYNIFCYSCKLNSYTCRILPYLIERHTPLFHLPSCTFGLSPDKKGTARAVISRIIRSENVLTLETSTFGWGSSSKPRQFHPLDLYKFAQSLTASLRCFLDKQSPSYSEAEKSIHRNYREYQQYDQQNEQESGSESEPEEDEIDFISKLGTIFDKKYQREFANSQPQAEAEEDAFEFGGIVIDQNLLEDRSKGIKANAENLGKEIQNGESGLPEQSQHRKKMMKTSQKIGLFDQKRPRKNSTNPSKTTFLNRTLRVRSNNSSIMSKHSLSRNKPALTLNHQKALIQSFVLKPRTSSQSERKETIRPKTIQHTQKRKNANVTIETKDQKEGKSVPVNDRSQQEIGEPKKEQQDAHNLRAASTQNEKNEHFEEKTPKEGFFSRFQSFAPFAGNHKNSIRLELLQQGLQKDDTSFQLSLMFENKRKLELQRLRKYFQNMKDPGQLRSEKNKPFTEFKRWVHSDRFGNF